MSKSVRRRGFTLPEVLVTITIVAVLAAVVVPAVLNQVSKGDNAALAGDVQALRTAISNFTTDTRHYPRTIGDLITKPLSTDDDLLGVDYGAAAVNAWKGPYFPTSQAVGTGTYTTSAFNMTINSLLTLESDFITLTFGGSGVTATNVATIDRLYDGGTGLVPANDCSTTPAATGFNTGSIRWTETDGTPCSITNLKWRLVSAAQ